MAKETGGESGGGSGSGGAGGSREAGGRGDGKAGGNDPGWPSKNPGKKSGGGRKVRPPKTG